MLVCLDSNIVIYLVERNPVWEPKISVRIATLQANGDDLAVCDAARLECLVKPYATGNVADQASYHTFFNSPTIRVLPVTSAVWDRAARMRATFKFQAMDSLHLATALEHGCGLFLTADAHLGLCTAIPIEVLA